MLITIKEFAEKISVSYPKAFQMSRTAEFIENGICVKLTPADKKGGYRIDYEKFLIYAKFNCSTKIR